MADFNSSSLCRDAFRLEYWVSRYIILTFLQANSHVVPLSDRQLEVPLRTLLSPGPPSSRPLAFLPSFLTCSQTLSAH